MTTSLTLPTALSIETCLSTGTTFGREMRGRARTKFEVALVRRLEALEMEATAAGLDAEEVTAAFDIAAWDGFEAPLTTAEADPA